MSAAPLLAINPGLDRERLAAEFKAAGRLRVRDVLTVTSAEGLRRLLMNGTQWGMVWGTEDAGQHLLRPNDLDRTGAADRDAIEQRVAAAAEQHTLAFLYAVCPISDETTAGWSDRGSHRQLCEELNSDGFLALARALTGMAELKSVEAQATLYAPGHFLTRHDDSYDADGWRVAYVLHLTDGEWAPDWGGCLQFYDEHGDIAQGFRPEFNTLNLFAVPQEHSVTYVPPFAPRRRYSLSGWLKDR